MRNTEGEIIQVEGGGHIVRSTGKKDRHSKVYTAKGLRDRRVRLSAHTAIEFYDVQDRLGYDRPSKAVDWLINKAKPSIDKLAELPPWNPISETMEEASEEEQNAAGSSDMANIVVEQQSESSCGYNFQLQSQFPPPTIENSSINFQNYPSDVGDLGLSLHSFQHQVPPFAAPTPHGFENQFQKIVTWNNETSLDMNRVGGFMVNSEQFLGQGSSFSPSVRSWSEIPMNSSEHHRSQPVYQASIFGTRFMSDGLAGFCIPERIQGDEEEVNHDGIGGSNRPSSDPPDSHH